MTSALALSIGLAASSGCGGGTSKGAAFLRITELGGSCSASTATGPAGIDQFAGLPYHRFHAAAAFEGGSHYPGGSVVALGWQDTDGSIGRIQIDMGADRGYGISAFPDAKPGPTATSGSWPSYTQGMSYVKWQGAERKFAAQQVWGILNYVPDPYSNDSPIGMSDHSGPWKPLALYAHLAIDGIGPSGEALCHVIALHAANDHDRTDSYDPAWLTLSPSALVIDGAGAPPTYAGDAPLGARLVKPGSSSADPGGAPPSLDRHAERNAPGTITGGGGDDGSGDCD